MRSTIRGVLSVVSVLAFSCSLAGLVSAAETKLYDKGLAAYNAGDYTAAYKFTMPLANQGHPAAKNLLGMMYELGKGVPQDLARSVSYYRQGAKQGDPYAQYNLAVSFDSGTGVPQNYREAVRWFRRAAEQGISAAQYDLGVMMERGRGVDKNFQKAANWYQKAAKQGHVQAQNNLAWLYEKGQGVERDLVTAYAWFDVAAAQGFESAQHKRDAIKVELTAGDLDKAQARSTQLRKNILQTTH
ncbi:MAG: sel1 repeat family protein [Gammaproteobacteria bacterium]|nr:sel1 repeat family protein [Gammaproteobacteria bacterium]